MQKLLNTYLFLYSVQQSCSLSMYWELSELASGRVISLCRCWGYSNNLQTYSLIGINLPTDTNYYLGTVYPPGDNYATFFHFYHLIYINYLTI